MGQSGPTPSFVLLYGYMVPYDLQKKTYNQSPRGGERLTPPWILGNFSLLALTTKHETETETETYFIFILKILPILIKKYI